LARWRTHLALPRTGEAGLRAAATQRPTRLILPYLGFAFQRAWKVFEDLVSTETGREHLS
jgi:hypothetical protein